MLTRRLRHLETIKRLEDDARLMPAERRALHRMREYLALVDGRSLPPVYYEELLSIDAAVAVREEKPSSPSLLDSMPRPKRPPSAPRLAGGAA